MDDPAAGNAGIDSVDEVLAEATAVLTPGMAINDSPSAATPNTPLLAILFLYQLFISLLLVHLLGLNVDGLVERPLAD